MKLFLLVLLFPLASSALSLENTFGGLTYHLWNGDGVAEKYSNKLNSEGTLIFTGLIGIGLSEDHETYRIFMGQNSIADIIYGATYSYTWKIGPVKAGPILGAYVQNDNNFRAKGITPFSLGWGIVPIIGIEASIKVLTFGDNYIRLNTIITPVLVNETLSLGVDL